MEKPMTKEQEYINTLRKEYIEKHIKKQDRRELIKEINVEKRDVRGYHGREILELLQNADDAYQKSIESSEGKEAPKESLVVTIRYVDGVLSVTNTGTFFDEEGVRAVVDGNDSSKTGNFIGSKGTGFRSVLNWAKRVRIFSGNFHLEFSKEIADREFQKIKNCSQIEKQLKAEPNLYIPMLAVPDFLEQEEPRDHTTIEIEIDPAKADADQSVREQIENIDLRILLFLPNMCKIEIVSETKTVVYDRQFPEGKPGTVLLRKTVDGKVEIEESFYRFNKKIEEAIEEDGVYKDILLSVAVPENLETFQTPHLYSFFPMFDTESPFPCVMHASYALGDQRNNLYHSESNREIIRHQIKHFLEVVDTFVSRKQCHMAYRLVTPTNFREDNWKFTLPFAKFQVEDNFLEELSARRIFESVNGENLSVEDGLKIMEGKYPDLFGGKAFRCLLKPTQDETVKNLIKLLAKRRGRAALYTEAELVEKINTITDSLTVAQRVELFQWWNQVGRTSLPNLLKDQNDQWLSYKQDCYLLTGDFENTELPSWVRVPAIRQEYQKALFEATVRTDKYVNIGQYSEETRIDRIICQNNLYPTVGFKYRDINNIVPTVNASVDTYEKAMEFVQWLWIHYSNREGWSPPNIKEGIKYKFPTANGAWEDSDKLYFGTEYGNPLGQKLFEKDGFPFPAFSLFGIEESEQEAFIEFISGFGVKKYPKVYMDIVESPDSLHPSYYQHYEREIEKKTSYGGRGLMYQFRIYRIKNLENLLTKLSTAEIVQWIHNDEGLQSRLRASRDFMMDKDRDHIFYRKDRRERYQKYEGIGKNYILEVFNETQWVELNGTKYAPRQILQTFNGRNIDSYGQLLPILDKNRVKEISEEARVEDAADILRRFAFADNVTDLCSDEFYRFMLELPKLEDRNLRERISKQIYRIMEQPSFSKEFPDSEHKRRFMLEGKLLVSYHGQSEYHPAKEAYLPSTKIVVKKDYPIVEKGYKTGNKSFVDVFGCKEYTGEYTVVESSIRKSDADLYFQEYFQEFKRYAVAYEGKSDKLEDVGKRIKITLVNAITVVEDGEEKGVTEEYHCIRHTETRWYVPVFGTTFDFNYMSIAIEQIYENIANKREFDSGKLGELFRARSRENREFLIKKEFGSLDVLEERAGENEIRTNFERTIQSMAPDYELDSMDVDFDDFYHMDNSPRIIRILQEIGADVSDFKEQGFAYTIDLIPYYKKQAEKFAIREKERFKNVLFTRAKENEELQESFLSTVYGFEDFYRNLPYENSVLFRVEEAFVREFGEWREESPHIAEAEKAYSENYVALHPENSLGDEIANDQNVKKMIYFNRVAEFQEWADQKLRQKEAEEVEGSMDPYAKYRGGGMERVEIEYSNTHPSDRDSDKHSSGRGVFTESGEQKRRRRQKFVGNIGELKAYEELCRQFGEEHVYPRSEAYVDLGILQPGQGCSGEYDLSYEDPEGSIHYVEVKTGDPNSFFISPNELHFAMEHAEEYELWLVFDIDAKPPKYEILKKFWEDPKYRRKDIIERIQFCF